MEAIIKNASSMENTITHLKNDLNILKQAYNQMRIKTLTQENAEIAKQVEEAKKKLIRLETSHGIKQIPIHSVQCVTDKPAEQSVATPAAKETPVCAKPAAPKPEGNKAPKKEKKKSEKKPEPEQTELAVDIGRLDLRVGQIMEVEKHPDADSLYVSKIQCGDPTLRTVVSGLVKFVPIEELKNRKVIVLCNLKPVKMRGVTSEAMVMCASTPEAVEVLSPPAEAQPGDLIECEGYIRQPDAQLNPKKKIFETVAPDLKTNNALQATYKGTALIVPGKGSVTAKSLTNVNIK
ncbi:aaRS-interacting multifunctional protein 1 [Carabus blaptoides fortunei]